MNSLFTLGLMIGMSVNDPTVGTTIANLGMTDVRFPAPLFEGDTVRVDDRSYAARASKSRPDAGSSSSITARSSRTARWSPNAGAPPSCAAADPRSSPPEAPMRSLLIAPADEKRLAEALASGADAIIVDLALAAPEGTGAGASRGGAVSQASARPRRRAGARYRRQRGQFGRDGR